MKKLFGSLVVWFVNKAIWYLPEHVVCHASFTTFTDVISYSRTQINWGRSLISVRHDSTTNTFYVRCI